MDKNAFSISKVAKILGITRQAVLKKINSSQIKAEKIGRNFVINEKNLMEILGTALSEKRKEEINKAVDKTIKEYGETLRLLGQE